MGAFNYAITGTGLKENIIKFSKALLFYSIVMFVYPAIVGWLTNMSFNIGHDAMRPTMSAHIQGEQNQILSASDGTFANMAIERDNRIFGPGLFVNRTFTSNGRTFDYSVVAPQAVLTAVMLVAGACMQSSTANVRARDLLTNPGPALVTGLVGLLMALIVIIVGVMAVLEYLIAFIEFMFITSVGIILFPLMLFEGTRSYSDKFIAAVVGHFIKLLFCTIVIFFTLYGFLALARTFSVSGGFQGTVDQIFMVLSTCILLLFISKSAPALASALMSGSPSLSAGGMMRTVAGTVAGVAAGASLAAGGVGLAAKGAIQGTGALAQAGKAASAASAGVSDVANKGNMGNTSAGGALTGMAAGARAFGGSLVSQAGSSIKSGASELTKSLFSGNKGGGGNNNPDSFSSKISGGIGQYYKNKLHEGDKSGSRMADDYNQYKLGSFKSAPTSLKTNVSDISAKTQKPATPAADNKSELKPKNNAAQLAPTGTTNINYNDKAKHKKPKPKKRK